MQLEINWGECRKARLAREIHLQKNWRWVEQSVWTLPMLKRLEEGGKGKLWFTLNDKVKRGSTLEKAFKMVKAKGGSAGCDHQKASHFGKQLDAEIKRIQNQLDKRTYRPQAVKRVWIDKPGSSEKRPLGIPTVRDRVIQTAVKLVIEPILENEFLNCSYGFRPGRGAKQALGEIKSLLTQGYTWVVDADIQKFFDQIPHDLLMQDVRKYIADRCLLDILESFLKQEVKDGDKIFPSTSGTPQGGVISPLLANLYLHPLDVQMTKAGFRIIRYADDFIVMCKTEEEAKQALDLASKVIKERGLTLHPEKSSIRDETKEGEEGGFDFLGYHFQQGNRRPSAKAFKSIKDTIRKKSRRRNRNGMKVIIPDLNKTLRGWYEYFKHGRGWSVFGTLDCMVRRRLRGVLRSQNKLRGSSHGGVDNLRWRNKYFQALGLFSLETAYSSELESIRNGTTNRRAVCDNSACTVRREGSP